MNSIALSMFAPLAGLLAISLSACGSASYTARPVPTPGTHAPGSQSIVIVRVPVPWYAPRSIVRGKFRDVLAEYEAIAPLQAKYFTISDDSRFGGIYLWNTRLDAEKHFDEAWREGVRKRRGVDADVMLMDAPFVVEGPAQPLGTKMGVKSQEYPASASFLRLDLPEGTSPLVAAKSLANASWTNDALIRGFIVTGTRFVGVVALWATRDAAETSVQGPATLALENAVGATASDHVLFEAPLLLDETLRRPLETR